MQLKRTSPPSSHGRQICRKRVANDGQRGQKYVCRSPTNAFKSFYFHLVCVCLSQTTVQGVWRPQSTIMGFGSRHCYVCDSENVDKNGFFEHMEGHSEDLKRFKFSNNTSDACRTSCKLCGRMVQLQRMRWRKSHLFIWSWNVLSSLQRANQYHWFWLKLLRSHTKSEHKMPITEYKSKFNIITYDIPEKVRYIIVISDHFQHHNHQKHHMIKLWFSQVFHKCGVCGLAILLDSDSVASHLSSSRATHQM